MKGCAATLRVIAFAYNEILSYDHVAGHPHTLQYMPVSLLLQVQELQRTWPATELPDDLPKNIDRWGACSTAAFVRVSPCALRQGIHICASNVCLGHAGRHHYCVRGTKVGSRRSLAVARDVFGKPVLEENDVGNAAAEGETLRSPKFKSEQTVVTSVKSRQGRERWRYIHCVV